MKLNQPETFFDPNMTEQFDYYTASNKQMTVQADCFDDVLIRGSSDFDTSKHPLRLIRYQLNHLDGTAVFSRPLWLAITGKRRKELSIQESFSNYRDRYDIEHYFRFTKYNLLADRYQTPETLHEEAWWAFVAVAYLELSFLKGEAHRCPKPWERYLPSWTATEDDRCLTPSQTERAYPVLLKQLGTTTDPPVPRGQPKGRKKGQHQEKRTRSAVIFKEKEFLRSSKKKPKYSNPQKTLELFMSALEKQIEKSPFPVEEVYRTLLNQKSA